MIFQKKNQNKSQSEHKSKQNIYLSNFKKQFKALQTPQFINQICGAFKNNSQEQIRKEYNIQSLLNNNRGTNVKKIHQEREKYRKIKENIKEKMMKFDKLKDLNLSEILIWKQDILTNFLHQFLQQISKQCRQKSQILLYIWNTVFNILEYLFQVIAKSNKSNQKHYLEDLLDNHQNYQKVIESLKIKLDKSVKARKQQDAFIQTLVYHLRFKRKEIKKLSKNLKVCTIKLNEFKQFYMDLQLEHIELLSQNRDISKENASHLVKRKQEINNQKRKQYKLKQSRKKIRFQIQNQLKVENQLENQNVQKLNQQLHSSFGKFYKQNAGKTIAQSKHATQQLFQGPLQDFNVRIYEIPDTENIIDYKTNIAYLDAVTDMEGFKLDTQDREVQVSFRDKFHYDMICHASIQTAQIKPKIKILEEIGIQVNLIELKATCFKSVHVIDKSYILQDYRDKRYKEQRVNLFQVKPDSNFKSVKSIKYLDDTERIKEQGSSSSFSTDKKLKKSKIKKNLSIYQDNFRQVQRKGIISNSLIKSKKKIGQKLKVNIESQEQLMPNKTRNLKRWGDSSQVNTSRNSQNVTPRGTLKRITIKRMIDQIKEAKYEELGSNDSPDDKKQIDIHGSLKIVINSSCFIKMDEMKMQEYQDFNDKAGEQSLSRTSINRNWTMKPSTEASSLNKKRFLKDLKSSDKLYNKNFSNNESSIENRKIINELDKISQQIEKNGHMFELIQHNINDNINILKEDLKKMLQKKKSHKKLALSRQQNLIKIISSVYTYAYHLYFNHNKSINNLIIPLFHYFKIGYGELKKNDLYLRMLYFLCQTIIHEQGNIIFQSFNLFLGLGLNQHQKIKIGKQNTFLYLKLLNRLSINFKFPLVIDQLYTTIGYIQKKSKQLLLQKNYDEKLVQFVIQRAISKINAQINKGQEFKDFCDAEHDEVKINVFKCCEFIIEELDKLRSTISQSYLPLFKYFPENSEANSSSLTEYILRNMYLDNRQYDQKHSQIEATLKAKEQSEGIFQSICQAFVKYQIPQFNKLFSLALSKFNMKQQSAFLFINKKLNILTEYFKSHQQQYSFQYQLILKITNKEQNSIIRQSSNKKILTFIYLRSIEEESQRTLENMLGADISIFCHELCLES